MIKEWISVKERLPEEGPQPMVLITDGHLMGIGYYEGDYQWCDQSDIIAKNDWAYPIVTHWMPLPESPKE